MVVAGCRLQGRTIWQLQVACCREKTYDSYRLHVSSCMGEAEVLGFEIFSEAKLMGESYCR